MNSRAIPLLFIGVLAIYIGTRGQDNLRAAWEGLNGKGGGTGGALDAPEDATPTIQPNGKVTGPAPAAGEVWHDAGRREAGDSSDGGAVGYQGITGGYFSVQAGR